MKHSSNPIAEKRLVILLIGLCALIAGGCRKEHRARSLFETIDGPGLVAEKPSVESVRELPMYDGRTGAALGWSDVLRAIDRADIVILGEQHDDAIGHAVQLAIVADAFARAPRGALTLEMLERDEQHIVDDYADGLIDAEALAKLTHSENWGKKGKWHAFYQPIIDAAVHREARIIAANAPRRYVRAAHLHDYPRLEALPRDRREYFDLPRSISDSEYRDRFFALFMPASEIDEDEAESTTEEVDDSTSDGTDTPEEQTTASAHGDGQPLTEEQVAAIFRSQLVWDATMAESIARAQRSGAKKIIHLVGQFHSDFEGGLIRELRQRTHNTRIMTVSLQKAWPESMREDDRGRADVIIYTGDRQHEDDDDTGLDADDTKRDDDVIEPPTTRPETEADTL